MRVLFSCPPSTGHLHPVLPPARAFARRGDEVALVTSAELAGASAGGSIREEIAAMGSLGVAARALAARTGCGATREAVG